MLQVYLKVDRQGCNQKAAARQTCGEF
jgi:hypothetical protein